MAVVQQSLRDGRNDDGVAEEYVPYSIDWLRRLLLRGRLWSGVWLLPEPCSQLKPTWRLPISHLPDNPLHTPVRRYGGV